MVEHTERHIVLFRDGLGHGVAQMLHCVAGLRVSESLDHDGSVSAYHLPTGEALLFRCLGAGIVHGDPDQLVALHGKSWGGSFSIEAERSVQITQFATDTALPSEAQDTWGLQTTGVTQSQFSGRGVRVAILDTGLDLEHPDFAGRSITSRSFVSRESVDDMNGHGTYCVGVACGPVVPKQPPRYGVAGDAEIYIGKIIANNGSGADGDILAGIDWAARSGCAVASLSVGTPVARGEPHSPIYEQVARRALAAGTLVIAAAGNGSLRPDCVAPVDHPANCPSILAISAVDAYLRIAPFSSGGINADGGEIDLAAPGVAIRSSWPRPNLYRTDSGTSMAVPYVAGIAALLAEANPSARGAELRALITKGARPLTLPARDVGSGLIQAP